MKKHQVKEPVQQRKGNLCPELFPRLLTAEADEPVGMCVSPHVGGCSPFPFASVVDEWSQAWRTGSELFSARCQRELQCEMPGGRLEAATKMQGAWRPQSGGK